MRSSPEPYVPNLKTLREKLDQDAQLLASLDPESDAYRRLQARITQKTAELLDYEEILSRREQAYKAAEPQRRQANAANEGIIGGLICAAIGFIVTFATWGSWWVVLGIFLFVSGLISLVGFAVDLRKEHE
jgi:hypothetical protein